MGIENVSFVLKILVLACPIPILLKDLYQVTVSITYQKSTDYSWVAGPKFLLQQCTEIIETVFLDHQKVDFEKLTFHIFALKLKLG